MQTVEKQGKSTSVVISDFMKEYNLKLEEFKFEVIDEGTKGFLGLFGGKPTSIRFTMPDVKEKIKEYAEGILSKLNAEYKSINVEVIDKVYHVNISSATDPGYIIGKEAKMLDSLQHILNQMINKHEKKQLKLKVDVDGYRQRRKDALLGKVKDIAEKVKTRGKSFTMEPMHAANRRVVHQFVEKDKGLRTMTIGDGEYKRVVIIPAGKENDFKAKKKPYPRRNNKSRPPRKPNQKEDQKTNQSTEQNLKKNENRKPAV